MEREGCCTGNRYGNRDGQDRRHDRYGRSSETPLQKVERLGEIIVTLCLLICAVVSIMGILRGEPFVQMLLGGISLAVAAVPEGLSAVVTIALAIGVRRMVQRNALIRRLPAVETLGCATVICSDKTEHLQKTE